MRALVYDGPRALRLAEVQEPRPATGEALVQVRYAGICGSDMHIYHGVHPRAKAPLIMGHEFAGSIVAVNGPGRGFAIGDKVVVEPLLYCGECPACRSGAYHVCARLGLTGIDRDGGFAEYVTVPIKALHRLPDGMPFQDGALVEPTAVAVHSVRMSRLKLGDMVAVLGAGPIGTLVAEACRAAGAGEVHVVDVNRGRIERARQRGFTVHNPNEGSIVEAIAEATAGKGADIVFDAAGAQSTAEIATKLVKIRGQIVVVAVFNALPKVNYRDVNFHELDVIGVRVYNYEDYAIAIRMVADKRIPVQGLATHVMSLEQAEQGFAAMEQGEGLKVLFRIGDQD